MSENELSYSIVQFSPRPERFEFVNVGVLVFDRNQSRLVSKLSSDFGRVKKFFGDASPSFLSVALEDFSSRVGYEFHRRNFEMSADEFNSKRAGLFQITPILPIIGRSASDTLNDLFADLVEAKIKIKRAELVSTRLTHELKDAGVLSLLKKRPKAVQIDKWGVSVKADYGYQNGVFNLIDSARFDDSERGLAEAGKRVLEGRALAETLEHRLVVVGDFGSQSNDFIENVRDELVRAGSKMFTIDEVPMLANEIRRTAH